MGRTIIFLFIVCLLSLQRASSQDSVWALNQFQKIQVRESASQTIIKHTYYTIGYFEKYKIPLWTYYSETREMILQCLLPRKGSFRKDPLTTLMQANKDDYAMPFEKGHLVPCEPMTFNEEAMKETFYYTNCAPQYEKVNSGRWKTLEKLVNNWTIDNLELMVFTGNVVSDSSARRGPHQIMIPDYCFKIILDNTEPGVKAIAFLVPNKDQKLADLKNYVTSIDSIEQLTGFDFFADIPEEEQATFESVSDVSLWDWKVGKHDGLFKELKQK